MAAAWLHLLPLAYLFPASGMPLWVLLVVAALSVWSVVHAYRQVRLRTRHQHPQRPVRS